jgi:hypothetical protein
MRALRLKKETVAELSAADLDSVVGAAPTINDWCATGVPTNYRCPTYDACFTTHGCA